ncbi:hypothetical protein [Scytonema sp. NUACC26]|uniref:hypothetical protein n=1 Tax=Scytonema sp. NUACC26 TaxID=3140176 RepID=UPI0034DC11E2
MRLQGTVAASTVQRRIKEKLGERETVSRATRRVLRCCVDWGVLEDTTEKGVYQSAKVQFIDNKALAAWLIEAALVASHSEIQALGRISQTPALFPFTVSPLNIRDLDLDLEGHQRLELFRQGLDENMVMLRR